MKYMALIYMNPDNTTPPDSPEFGKMMAGYQVCNETYRKDGVYVTGDALQPATTATTVKVRNGRTESMDGPFAETKEQLGGFYILDCKDLDEAIRYAAMIPHAANGAVEVRPIMVFDR
ncbi:YciI family protein [Rhizobium sp. KVB221]|uniref:YciI family protein n=1 Tax=Rhizobium setariae TaxID=2801340 RepID=A0A937CQL7_9HYPH|nr:YciI family protein [Rhizobium setariae]MBL0374664.1 YciI family protein [Rhizobium setariae]